MSKPPTIFSRLTPAEQAAWIFILAFARERAAAIVRVGWRETVTDLVLSEILENPHLRAHYCLAIGNPDPMIRGSRRKGLLNQEIGRRCKAGSEGIVRVVGGIKEMQSASVGPHAYFTVLDNSNPPGARL